jgi:type III secretion system chaperone SycN
VSNFTDVVQAFAAEIGTGLAELADGRPAVFRFERSGRLFLEMHGERVLVYLEFPDPVQDPRLLAKALAACDPRRALDFPMRAGLSAEDRLVVGVSVDEPSFALPLLHRVLDQLMREQGEIGA